MAKTKLVTYLVRDVPTTAPDGLTITRDGGKFTFAWKICDKDYDAGQALRYRINNGPWSGTANPGAKATSYAIQPGGAPGNITRVDFQVQGKRKEYTTGKGNNQVKNIPKISAPKSCSWIATPPNTPTLTYAKNSGNSGTFTWSTDADNSGKNILNHVEYETWTTHSNSSAPEWPSRTNQPASGSMSYTESFSGQNVVRWVRVQSAGPAGWSGWVTAHHAYGNPAVPQLTHASAVKTSSDTMQLTVAWNSSPTLLNPIDTITVQYAIAVPTDTSLSAPATGWTDAVTVTSNGGGDMVVVSVSEAIGTDECMWVRVMSKHDDYERYSGSMRAATGALETPGINANVNFNTGVVALTITENTSCDVAATAIFYRPDDNPSQDRIVAIFPNGTTTGTVTVADLRGKDKSCFGAYAFVGTFSGTTIRTRLMWSGSALDSDIAAIAPAWLSLSAGSKDKTVRVTWDWTWANATAAEISWADHDDAWESTDQPKTYAIDDIVKSWVVAGLDVGRWYFRVRLKGLIDSDEVTGPWSEIYDFDLSGIPDRPALILNKSIINAEESVTARWAYVASDDTSQQYAEICLATISALGVITYGEVIARVTDSQTVSIKRDWVEDQTYYMCLRLTSTAGRQSEWSEPVALTVAPPVEISLPSASLSIEYTAEDYTLDRRGVLRYIEEDQVTTVESSFAIIEEIVLNQEEDPIDPDNYSIDMSTGLITFDPPLETPGGCVLAITGYQKTESEIVNSSRVYKAEDYVKYQPGEAFIIEKGVIAQNYLRIVQASELDVISLPLSLTVIGAGVSGTTTVSIIRAEDYHIYRPDDSEFDGFEGETIVTKSQTGEDQMTISYDELIGHLDDGAKYTLRCTVIDDYGQTASIEFPINVEWSHQAGKPTATVKIDEYQRIAMITPTAPTNYRSGDVCDIYRLSADKPELVFRGAEFGQTYVDPYPGFGDFCGHRLVTRTANGDYITRDNELAWFLCDSDVDDILEEDAMIIDVNGNQIELPYNIELQNTWTKDFKRTTYLGGAVQGDWNPAVTRDTTANTVILRGRDLDKQISMRGLAGYAGLAHIRTPDGSSMACDIQVRETSSYQNKRVSYSLSIKVIDPPAPEGMLLADWQDMNPPR
jgi:hypothetical protein